MSNLATKYATCPKSPSHTMFKELVEIKGKSFLMLDQSLQPFELTQPHEMSVSRRSVAKVCAICGAAATTWLPKAFRSP